MTAGVYSITCNVSGNAYVGSSRNMRARWNSHRADLRKGRHHCAALQQSWNKHGESAFVFKVLEHCEEHDLLRKEQSYLDTGCFVYNSAQLVNSPSPLNREIARKHAKEVLSKLPWTAERRAKLSKAGKGRPNPISASAKVNMSIAAKARKNRIGPWTIRKLKQQAAKLSPPDDRG